MYSSDLKIINGKVFPEWWRKSGHIVNAEDIHDILKEPLAISLLELELAGE